MQKLCGLPADCTVTKSCSQRIQMEKTRQSEVTCVYILLLEKKTINSEGDESSASPPHCRTVRFTTLPSLSMAKL